MMRRIRQPTQLALALILTGVCWAGLIYSGTSNAGGWSAYELLAEKAETWTVHGRAAGVSGPANSRIWLTAQKHCVGRSSNAVKFSFGSLVAGVYRLYFVSELVPAIQAGNTSVEIRVDDGEAYRLQHESASIDNLNQLLVSGILVDANDQHPLFVDRLMSGSKATISLSYNGNLMLSQSFSLRASADALGSVRCPEPSSEVADSNSTSSP